jgi:hypothetical protein
MKPIKNYIDEKGNYHNVENLTLTQIYDSGVQEGYRIAKQESGCVSCKRFGVDCKGCEEDEDE